MPKIYYWRNVLYRFCFLSSTFLFHERLNIFHHFHQFWMCMCSVKLEQNVCVVFIGQSNIGKSVLASFQRSIGGCVYLTRKAIFLQTF